VKKIRIQINEHKNTVTFSISCQHAKPDVIKMGGDRDISIIMYEALSAKIFYMFASSSSFSFLDWVCSENVERWFFKSRHVEG
jgi:hypothetical protein